LGNNSPEALKTNYTIRQLFINPQLIVNLYRKFFIGLSFEWQSISDFSYIPNDVFDAQNITGRTGGVTTGAGLLLTYDSRNNAYSPTRGSFFEINVTDFEKDIGSDYNFLTGSFDVRKFFSLHGSTVLACQSLVRFNKGDVPIRYLSMLGGTEMMRGYYKGRYTDRNLFALQTEIRQYLFWRIGVAAFASAGEVAGRLNDFKLNDFHYAYGGGLRIMMHEKEKLNLRVDFGFGKESHGIYVIMKEAF
jgi:outer membrane protein assembly factor BamA